MKLHLHHLEGCAPTPLAHYLKALGILRVVSRQKDPEARGFWRDERFGLLTTLGRAELERFFLDEYAPTPFVSPWNRGSGFYAARDPALAPLEASIAPRFAAYREGIAASRKPLEAITSADAEVRRLKDSTKKKKGMSAREVVEARARKDDPTFKARLSAAEREYKRLKADLYAPFASSWRGGHREWLDAAMVLAEGGAPAWPALLGTGGNDGRLDFTNNAMQRIGELFDLASPNGAARPNTRALLSNSLWGTSTTALQSAAVGQFIPGSAGGANGSTGPFGDALVNPWDFVLMLEGAVLFRGQATRRLGVHGDARASIPFAVHAHAAGHGTRGREKTERGEQWMPFWSAPSTLTEIEALFGEGRAQLGRMIAQRPIDFVRAVAKLGVARGLTGFVRYGYLERNGQSKIAVPLGRIDAGNREHAHLVDDIAGWIDRLQRLVRGGDAPTRLYVAEATLSDAIFAALQRDDASARWRDVLIAAARVEALQVTGTGFEAGPLPALSAGWLDAAAEDGPEWRLAVALGSAAARYARGRASDPVRCHALPLDVSGRRYATTDRRLTSDPRVVFTGRDPLGDLIALVERRLVEATQSGQRTLPLISPSGAGARPSDLAAFIEGRVDVSRVYWLARALMAIRWETARFRGRWHIDDVRLLDESWQALRLCGLPYEVSGRQVPLDAAVVRRLASGDGAAALTSALRRLRSVGLRPPIRAAIADQATARRWVAALAFPIDRAVAEAMADQLQFQNLVTMENA